MNVGELFGTLSIDDREWDSGLKGAGREFDRFSDSVEDDLDDLERAFEREAAAFLEEMERGFADLDDVVEEAFAQAEREAAQGSEEIADRVRRGIDDGLDGAVDAARGKGRQIGEKIEAGVEQGLDAAERSARQSGERIGDEVGDGVGTAAEAGGQKAGGGMMTALKGAGIAAAAGAALAIADQLMQGIEQALANEKSGDLLAAQLDLTAEQSQQAGQVAGELYVQAYGESVADVDKAVGAVMSSFRWLRNGSVEQLEDITAAAMDFATAFELEVTRAAQVAGTVLQSGLARDAKHAFDLMTTASQRVPAQIREDLLDSIDEYGQFFNSLGFSGEQAFALLVKASDKGVYGLDKMGDSLKEFLLLSTDLGSSSVTDAYEAIGLDAKAMSDAILAGGDSAQEAFQKIVTGLEGIKDPTDQAAAAIGLFGTPLEDLNKGEIPAFLDQLRQVGDGLGDVSGKTDQLGATLADNAATKIETFKRGLEQNVVTFIGGSVLPALDGLVEKFKLTGVPEAIADVVGKGKELVREIVADVQTWADEHQAQIDRIVELSRSLYEQVSGYVGDLIDFVREIWNAGGEEWLSSTITTIEGILNTLGGFIEFVRGTFQLLKGIFTGDSEAMMQGGKAIIEGGLKLIEGLFDMILGSVVELVGGKWEEVKQWTRDAFSSLVDWATGLPGRLIGGLASLGARLYSWATTAWHEAKSGAIAKAAELVAWVTGLPSSILSSLGDLGSLLLGAGRSILEGLWQGMKNAAGWVKDKVMGLISDIIPGPVRSALGIASPSKVMAEIGRWVPAGLAEGILDNSALVEDASRELAGMVSGHAADMGVRIITDGAAPDAPSAFDRGDPGGTRPGGGALVAIEHYHEAGHAIEDVSAELAWMAQGGGG